jgi:hypothetical protein
MQNTEILDRVSAKVDELEAAFTRYDDLGEQREQLAADLAATQKQAEDVLNDESLSHDDATAKLITARARIDVLQVRVTSMDGKIAAQRKLTLDTGKTAQSAADAVRYALLMSRTKRAHDLFATNFKWHGTTGSTPADIVKTSPLVTELAGLERYLQYNHHTSPDTAFAEMRELKAAFASLRAIVEGEPELEHAPTSHALTVVARAA